MSEESHKACVMAGWDDVPHLSEQMKAEMEATYLPHQRNARKYGIPSIGAGAIYPYESERYLIEPIPLPEHWPRIASLDVGWERTAALWGAWDRESGAIYLYSEHYATGELPSVHASAIRGRGRWIPIMIDPNSRGRSPTDGSRLYDMYSKEGLNLGCANRAVESGIYKVSEKFQGNLIKVFSTLQRFQWEIRMYRRDQKGKIVKKNDHLMDCLRYLVMAHEQRAQTRMEASRRPDPGPAVADAVAGY